MDGAATTTLADFIRARGDAILADWESAVRAATPPAQALGRTTLFDHVPQILGRIAEIAESLGRGSVPPLPTTLADVHALERLAEGFELEQVVAEFTTLRDCIMTRWWAEAGPPPIAEVQILQRAVDRAIHASVSRFIRARDRTLKSLDLISAAALESRETDELLARLLGVLVETTESVDTAAILLTTVDDPTVLELRASIGLEDDIACGFRLRIGEGFAGSVAAAGRPSMIADAAHDPLVRSPALRARGVRALYATPLSQDGQVIGVAQMGSRLTTEFSEQDKRLFAAMANRATAAITLHLLRADAERRRAELEAVFEAMPDAIFLADERGVTSCNRAALQLTGAQAPADLVGPVDALRRRFSIRDAADAAVDAASMPIARALAGEHVTDELRITTAAGESRDVRVAAAPVIVEGRPRGGVAVATDLTHLRDLERAREDFIGMVVHDLRTPLAAVRSLAQLTCRALETTGDKRNGERVERILSQVDRMGRLLSDMLDVTLADRGKLPVELQRFDLGQLVREVAAIWATSSTSHVFVVNAPDEASVCGDPDRLTQILNNLLSNAVKYSPRGGHVRVSVAACEDVVATTIADEGIGMTAEEVATIFRPYARATGATSQRIRGHGLGLHVVASLVRAHGGAIEVQSEPGKGTRVRFTIPRARSTTEARGDRSPSGSRP